MTSHSSAAVSFAGKMHPKDVGYALAHRLGIYERGVRHRDREFICVAVDLDSTGLRIEVLKSKGLFISDARDRVSSALKEIESGWRVSSLDVFTDRL
ncbi:MAG: hypothetical protein AAF221_08335 [Pseudomonadota bacterium]